MHLAVAKRMYEFRFPNMDVSNKTLQQLRGMEGIRIRKAYELSAKMAGVSWKKRSYKQEDWDEADPINQALSEGNALLYGICHAAIVSLGYSTGLGFIHTGKQLSFVYDIADLYKVETTIPAAFEVVKKGGDLSKETRICCRKYFARIHLLDRIAQDIAWILQGDAKNQQDNAAKVGELWEQNGTTIHGGKNYAGQEIEE